MSTPMKIALAGILVVVLGVTGWLALGDRPAGEAAHEVVELAPTPTHAERLSARLARVTLGTSDAAVRQLASELSSRPERAVWLAADDLIRRFVASVDNAADGVGPKGHNELLRLAELRAALAASVPPS